MKKIRAIIVIYNGMQRNWIQKCFDSVLYSDVSVEIIAIDNGSTDGSIEFIQENYPTVELIVSEENLGFGRANNLGIREALHQGAEYVFLLNQDASLEKNTISELIGVFLEYPEYGVLSPMQMNGIGNELDENFAANLFDIRNCPQFTNDYKKQTIERVYDVRFVMAALWLIKRETIEKVGFFSPIFVHYGEDNDYLNRVKYHGFKAGVVTSCKGYHDRESRKISLKKKMEIDYEGVLANLTNINHNLISRYCFALKFFLSKMINCIREGEFALTFVNFRLFTEKMMMIKQIYLTRKKNRN